MALAPGQRFGAYEIGEPLGAGGMGEVYRATDTTLDREVAIKVLPESFASDPARIARFEQEAKTLAALNHAHIAQIYGLERADNQTAIVMELIEGPTLADRIEQGPLPPDQALSIAMQIATALEAAHERSIVHRDLKPANIKLKDDGTVKVLDFGIAKAFEPLGTTSGGASPVMTTPVTQTGIILGTAAYMSPEQARGKPVDRRTDIWAFGCVLYEMLTGQPAFGGEDVAVTLARIIAHGADTDSLPGTISPAVRHTIELCLEKDPRRRLADIADVRLGLEGRLESDVLSPATGGGRSSAPSRLRLGGAAIAGAVVAGAVAFVVARPAPVAPAPVSRFMITTPATAPLANLGGYDFAISPDGRRIAYFGVHRQSNKVALYVRDLDTLEARLLPGTEVTPGNQNLFFSDDGSWIGYLSPGEGIMRAAVNGGTPLKITDAPSGGFLSAAVASDNSMIFSGVDGLYRVSTGGSGTPTRLTPEPEAGQPPYIAPVLLPGERAVLFTFGNERLAVLDLDTGEQKILVEGGAQNPRYAATGHIVFARATALMAVPFDLDALELTGEPVALPESVRRPDTGSAADFALSATGTLAYVPDTGETYQTELVWVDRNGEVSERALAMPLNRGLSPRLSPDGQRVALTARSEAGQNIWVYGLDGRPPIPLTVDGNNGMPAWSPDGTQVAFNSNRGGPYSLYVVPADGSVLDPQPVRSDENDLNPLVWSADDDLILLRCCGAEDLLAATPDFDSELRDVVATSGLEYDGALSPNGRWLAYANDRTGQVEIWVKRYPDGVPVRVSSAGGIEPRWSHDGTELFYLSGNAMMAVAVDADDEFSFRTAVELFDGPYLIQQGPYNHSYDVASDGRFLMMLPAENASSDQRPPGIVVVENWYEELERLVPTE